MFFLFFFIFIFGGFETALPNAFFSAGMLKLISHSLGVYRSTATDQPALSAIPSRSSPPFEAVPAASSGYRFKKAHVLVR